MADHIPHDPATPELAAPWRKSSFSDQGACVELAPTTDGRVAVRNSKAPAGGTLIVASPSLAALLRDAKGGDLDHLTA